MSLLSVLLAVLLAPLLVAQSANAASPMEARLAAGGRTWTDGAGTSHGLAGIGHRVCGQSYCSDDQAGKDTVLLFNGAFASPSFISFCYLDSRFTTQGADALQCATQSVNSNMDQVTLADGNKTGATSFATVVGANYYAGLVCVGDPTAGPRKSGDAPWVNGGPNYACGLDQPSGADGWALPRNIDMGHKAESGGGETTLPGQKEDGSIDPIACIQQSLKEASGASGDGFDPIGYIFTPVKCAFLWATTMPTDTIPSLVGKQQGMWDKTQLGATAGAINFYSAFSVDNGCQGIAIPLDGLRTPGGPTIKPLRLLNACDGDMLAGLASLVKIGLTLAVLFGGVFAIARMISQFVKGPSPAPAHASTFDDILMG